MTTKRELIEAKAIELLKGTPQGIRTSQLINAIKENLPDVHLKTINGTVWKLPAKRPGEVYKPSRDLFRYVSFRENQSPQVEKTRQLKLNNFPSQPQKKRQEQERQIIIARIDLKLVWDELILEVEFKLTPNKDAFSKIKTELWFDQEKTKSFLFDILHSFGPTDEFKFKATLDLEGLPSGNHSVKIEMYEFWSFLEKNSHTEKEITFYYSPQNKETRLRKVPLLKKIEGDGIAVISGSEKEIYREIQETMKKDAISKRDEW